MDIAHVIFTVIITLITLPSGRGMHPDDENDLRMEQEERNYLNKQCYVCKKVTVNYIY